MSIYTVEQMAEHVRKAWVSSANYSSFEDINKTGCYNFAKRLVDVSERGRVVNGVEVAARSEGLSLSLDLYSFHFVAEIDGLFYDAENPEGVDHLDKLAFYKRSIGLRDTFGPLLESISIS